MTEVRIMIEGDGKWELFWEGYLSECPMKEDIVTFSYRSSPHQGEVMKRSVSRDDSLFTIWLKNVQRGH